MPSISELAGYFSDLRAHFGPQFAGKEGLTSLGCSLPVGHASVGAPRSGFEIALAVLLGFDKAGEALSALRSLARGVTGDAALPLSRDETVLLPETLLSLPSAALESAVRLSGNARLSFPRVRGFLEFAAVQAEAGDALFTSHSPFFATDVSLAASRRLVGVEDFRFALAGIRGISLETADLLLLFALETPVFPVGAQTWRFLRRHGFIADDAGYEEMQEIMQSALDAAYVDSAVNAYFPGGQVTEKEPPVEDEAGVARYYKECWFLLRRLCSGFCRASKFSCSACPLGTYMEYEPCE